MKITEAELARDLHAVLEKVRQGVEIVIEQDSHPVAVLKRLKFLQGLHLNLTPDT